MKINNKSNHTINFTRKSLTYLRKHAPLTHLEAVKAYIATMQTSDAFKKNLCTVYNAYCKFYHIQWNLPKYRQEEKNVALPTREKLQMLIAEAGKTLGTKLQMSMEIGLRPIELCRLKVKNIDLDHKTVNPTTAKGGNARTILMTANLTAKIQQRILTKNLTPEDKLFGNITADQYGRQYRTMRNKLAQNSKPYY